MQTCCSVLMALNSRSSNVLTARFFGAALDFGSVGFSNDSFEQGLQRSPPPSGFLTVYWPIGASASLVSAHPGVRLTLVTVNRLPHSPHIEIAPGIRSLYLPCLGPSGIPASWNPSLASTLAFFAAAAFPFAAFLRFPLSTATVVVALEAEGPGPATAPPGVVAVCCCCGGCCCCCCC